jgi:hypothetical protein
MVGQVTHLLDGIDEVVTGVEYQGGTWMRGSAPLASRFSMM